MLSCSQLIHIYLKNGLLNLINNYKRIRIYIQNPTPDPNPFIYSLNPSINFLGNLVHLVFYDPSKIQIISDNFGFKFINTFYEITQNAFGVITLPLFGRVEEPTCWRCGEGY